MVSPFPVTELPAPSRSWPLDQLDNQPLLHDALAAFADRYRPVEKRH
ncbi:hypothetical protein [Arthrobacter sp. B1I2]|nr:hypothetical protein [Arthrobacter sp. B1I2]MDQ0732400.1 hypothetical protein [Arthrobacter sp. B1I2]